MRWSFVVLLVVISVSALFLVNPVPASAHCPSTPWNVPTGDEDCDGFASSRETYVGTLPLWPCTFTATANDEPDAWPPDFNDDQKVGLADILAYIPWYLTSVPPAPARLDLNQDGMIGLADILTINPFYLQSCTVVAPAPPGASTSRYMSTVDPTTLYSEGCSQGDASPDDSIVVLDFGQPQLQDGVYGTLLFDAETVVSAEQIAVAAHGYLDGFWDCTNDTPWKHLTLAIGTNNYKGLTGSVTFGHGQAWAQMVNGVNDYIDAFPSYRARETAWGANDIQLDWSSAPEAGDWADGYDSANNWRYVNYGSAEGCPPFGPCNNGWTPQDVHYVSWGAPPAWPLPEIYTRDGNNAVEWQRIKRDVGYMLFLGAFTEEQACREQPTDDQCLGGC